jgi:hypothetical protein
MTARLRWLPVAVRRQGFFDREYEQLPQILTELGLANNIN